jgi:hypothetical protein
VIDNHARSFSIEEMRLAVGSLLLFLLTACGQGPQPRLPTGSGAAPAPGSAGILSEAETRDVVEKVVKLRGLTEKRRIVVKTVSEEAFDEAFEKRRELLRDMKADKTLIDEAPKDSPDVYLAFYDELSKVVYLRQRLPKWAREGTNVRGLLAHEVTHALQDQHFSLAPLRSEGDREKLLAFKAMIEGDAEVTRIAFEAIEKGRPPKRAVARESVSQSLSVDALVRLGVFSPELMKLPPQAREYSVYPYLSGRNFVATLFRAGGFPLVDRAYAKKPESTEQILHPERYLAGKTPVRFPDPSPPPGYALKTVLTFGELGTRILLSRLGPREAAVDLADGWSGDRVGLFRGPRGESALLWVSSWSDEGRAGRFVSTMAAPAEASRKQGKQVLELLMQRGNRVAFVTGLQDEQAAQLARGLLANEGVRSPAKPPLGPVVVPPLPERPSERLYSAITVDDASYRVPGLTLVGPIPQGFTGRPKPQSELLLVGNGSVVMLEVTELDQGLASVELLHRASATGFTTPFGNASANTLKNGTVKTPLGAGTERLSFLPSKQLFFRSVIVPICNARAAMVLAFAWQDGDPVERTFDGYLDGLRKEGSGPLPYCKELEVEATTDLP